MIEAVVHGVGTATADLDLVNAAGESICQKVYVTEYSKVKCLTKAADFGAEAGQISVKVGGTPYACASTDTTKCAYTQSQASTAFPAITSVAKGSDTTIVFTGTQFYTIGYDATASFMGVSADSVTVDGETATATWALGVPTTSSTGASPSLEFTSTLDAAKPVYYAILPAAGITLANPFVLKRSDGGMQCSFQGGCLYSLTGTSGLATIM